MGRKKKQKVERRAPYIELEYSDVDNLKNLHKNEVFVAYILEETLESIEYAIENKLKKIDIFNIINLSVVIELKKSQFKPALEKISEFYAQKDEFEKCIDIQKKLISKL